METLQAINADLDAERCKQLKIRAVNTNFRFRDVQEEGVYSAGCVAIVAEAIPQNRSSIEMLQQPTQQQDDNDNENFPETDTEDTEHMKLLNSLLVFFNLMGLLVGIEMVFGWTWKQPRYMFAIILLIFFWFSIAYTAYTHYANGNLVRVLEPFVMSGVSISCTLKIISTIRNMGSFVALILNYRTMCRRVDKRSTRATVLRIGFAKTKTLMIVFTIGVAVTASLILFVPLKVYITEGVVIPIIPVEFIFVETDTTSKMMMSNFVLGVTGIYATVGSLLYGLSFITYISLYAIGVELLIEDFRDLDNMWADKTKHSIAYRHAFLRNICIKRQDLNRYLGVINTIYALKMFWYFCSSYFSQILCLYQILINDWQGGYGLALGLVVEMFFYCVMGTKISIVDDRLCYIIYDTNWYEYDIPSQRVILMLLKEAQRERDITLKFIGPLSLVTFVTIVKSMYSYYTVLSEML